MIPSLATWVVMTVAVTAHPLHTTHTTIAADANRVTIEIRAFTDDLHTAMAAGARTTGDSAIAQYVRRRVTLTDAAGRPVPLQWDSAVPDGDMTRIRVHATAIGSMPGLRLCQAMQTEIFSDQVNVVLIQLPAKRVTVLFTPGDGFRRIT